MRLGSRTLLHQVLEVAAFCSERASGLAKRPGAFAQVLAMLSQELMGGDEWITFGWQLPRERLLHAAIAGGVVLLLLCKPQAQQDPQAVRFQREYRIRAREQEYLLRTWIADGGEFLEYFLGLGKRFLDFSSKIVFEDIVRQFCDLAQALGAEFRNDSTHPRNFFQLSWRCLENLFGSSADSSLQSRERRSALFVIGQVGDIFKQNEFERIGDLRRFGATVELLELFNNGGE